VKNRVPAWKAAVVKMAAPFLGELLINSGVDPYQLMSNEEEVTKVFHDRLMLPFMTVRWAKEILVAVSLVKARVGEIDKACPLLMLHGSKDTVTCAVATEALARTATSRGVDAHFILVADGLHELHHDSHKTSTLQRVLDWLDEMSPDNTPSQRRTASPKPSRTSRKRQELASMDVENIAPGIDSPKRKRGRTPRRAELASPHA